MNSDVPLELSLLHLETGSEHKKSVPGGGSARIDLLPGLLLGFVAFGADAAFARNC